MADTTTPVVENTGWRGLVNTLWQRIVLSYKSTLIAIGIEVLAVLADNMVNSPNKTITIIGSVIASILLFYKEKIHPKTLVAPNP